MGARDPLVLLAAGGTGGHVFPGLAVAEALLARGCRVEWVGSRRGLEQRVVPAAGLTLHRLPVRGIRGKGLLRRLLGLLSLGAGVLGALWLILRRRPRCVVGMGGYVSAPVGIAAWLSRRPLVIHEQNAVAGSTNRALARCARRVLAAFPDAFPPGVDSTVVGNPLRRALVEAAAAGSYDYDATRPLRLLVLGGSLGAAPINEVMPGMLRRFARSGSAIEVWHQAGELHVDALRTRYGASPGAPVRVEPFIDDMVAAYDWADLVLCRAGALTVSELALMGRPAILVPLPHAIDDHQSANARHLSQAGAAEILLQNQMDAYKLARTLREYGARPERLAAMARAARAVATPHAAERVADCCEELLHGG